MKTVQHSPTACPACQTEVPEQFRNTPDMVDCPACHQKIQLFVFSATFQKPAEYSSLHTGGGEHSATCFYHPEKKAVIPCDFCGVFLCDLCQIELNHQHFCSKCIATGQKKDRFQFLEKSRFCHDKAALVLAILPCLTVWLTLLTAPLTILYVVWSWKKPGSLVTGPSKWRLLLAIFIALIEISLWIYVFIHR